VAVKYDEAEILTGGIKYDRPSKGSFALNMLRRYGAWEVRQGFGQLTQFDCRMTHNIGEAGTASGASAPWGYQKHLGSYAIHTDFGHDQIISLFKARVYTSEVDSFRAQIANIYMVNIYDVTTREWWEEPLYRHTSEGGTDKRDLEVRRGLYETNFNRDFQSWVLATSEETFSFTEVRDTVYFGSPATDLYAYTPCTFRGNRRRFVSGAHPKKWAPPYAESSMIWRVKPSPGAFTAAYNYRTESGIPSPQALTSWGGRLVVAGNGREVFFSQKDRPTSFIDIDYIIVPTDKQITAMVPMGQSIYIFTESETFAYQPSTRSDDPIASGGLEPVRISDSIGCVSQSCVTKKDSAAVWLSSTGVHLSGGGLEVQTISADIAPLFTDFITDPATSFFTSTTAETGSINITLPQRNSVITLKTKGASVVFSELLEAVLVTLPDENVSLCFSGEQWSLWTYESNTSTAAVPNVGAVKNILSPWPVAIDKQLYLVGSTDVQALTDAALYAGVGAAPVDDDTTSMSAYILEYGRGGAIDRSVDDEDYRTIAGKYLMDSVGASGSKQSTLVLGEWITVEQQYKFRGTAVAALPNGESAPAAPARTVLMPVYLVPGPYFSNNPATAAIEKVEITFAFDNSHWRPIFTDALTSTNLNLILPAERQGSAAGWSAGTGIARCETAAGVANRGGNVIHMIWDGAASAHTHSPKLNVVPERLNLLGYIPMQTISNTFNVSGMGLEAKAGVAWCTLTDGAAATSDTDILAWREWRLVDVRKEDSVAQPVDWAYMSEDVGLPEDARLKARGLSVRLLSHDQGYDITGGWTQGQFNTMMAADLKTWMAQTVDYVGGTTFTGPVSITTNLYPTAMTEEAIRDRIRAGGSAMQKANFATYAAYGNPATTTFEQKACLIGDEQVDEITTSDSVKGNSVATMLFGFMRNPAERLKLESVKLLYRIVGAGRRRRGR